MGHLLVIDDEPDIARFIATVAEEQGYQVTVAPDAESFLDAYRSDHPDVIVVDIVMPNIDGIELVKFLAQDHCAARVLVISGYAERYLNSTKTLGEAFGLASVTTMRKPLELTKLEDFLAPEP